MKLTKAERAADMRALGWTIEEIAAHFGWTYLTAASSISRGKNLDHHKSVHRAYMRTYQRKPRPRKPGSRIRGDAWNDHAIRYLKAGYGFLSAREIAGYVGRSRNAVIGKARRLGLAA